MKHSNFGHKLVFGLLGGTYTVVGGVLLALAISEMDGVLTDTVLSEDNAAFGIVGLVFTVLGVAFLIVTLLLARADKRHARMREELLTWGSRIKGEVVDVRVDYTLWDAHPAVGNVVEVIYDPMDEKRYVIEFPAE